MLDIQLLRKDLADVALRLRDRGYVLDTEKFERIEAERKAIQTRTQELQARRNALSKEIGAAKSRGEDTSAPMAEVGAIGGEVDALERELADIQTGQRDWLLAMPNLAHASVPVGQSEAQNVEVRRWGTPRSFDFEPRDHVDIGAAVGGLVFARSAKLAGARLDTLRHHVECLHRALGQLIHHKHLLIARYAECYVTSIVTEAPPSL